MRGWLACLLLQDKPGTMSTMIERGLEAIYAYNAGKPTSLHAIRTRNSTPKRWLIHTWPFAILQKKRRSRYDFTPQYGSGSSSRCHRSRDYHDVSKALL